MLVVFLRGGGYWGRGGPRGADVPNPTPGGEGGGELEVELSSKCLFWGERMGSQVWD